MADPIDGFDRKILRLIQHDCHLKAEAIAEAVGLSASAVQRRLKRLRSDAVIAAEVAVLDRNRTGPLMTFIAGVEIERDNYDALPKFRLWLAKQQSIQQAYYVTGPIDVILIILAQDIDAFDSLCSRMMAQNPQIRRINTNVVLNVVKLGLNLPIDLLT
ncbi:Lrp/AsnC family transcriptional regulator [Acidisoma cellulosilytica]|uniref:Lrp/AsnC family transcriptional regulator n=1 Tax=Acidisoma cellulosilyticum TaxID=2802395 RepID=A0A963YYC0_9PROT|nr:Lrp/AsnC family transcriptional regulator [Acidisoma cellulosilyticum]MCB8879039.1 Lrp/AsnC family transcriptional regulator [Acidisoma cellulosilyticum]